MMAALASTIYVRASAFILSHGVCPDTHRYAWRLVRLIGGVAIAIGLLIGALFSLMGAQFMPKYVGILPFLWIALLCTAFRCMNLCLTAFIQALGAYGKMFRISIVNAFTVTSGVLTLGALMGPIGAALGVCLGEALNTGIQSITLQKLLKSETSR
jgi:O-antigen/teichoic acid export membrane protein